MRTLEQIVREAMGRHGHGKPPLCDECKAMYAVLRSADAELQRGREAEALLRRCFEDQPLGRCPEDYDEHSNRVHKADMEACDWLAAHPEEPKA